MENGDSHVPSSKGISTLQYSQFVTPNMSDAAYLWPGNEIVEERNTQAYLRNNETNSGMFNINDEGYDPENPLALDPEEESRAIQDLLEKLGMRKDNWANILIKDGEMVGIFSERFIKLFKNHTTSIPFHCLRMYMFRNINTRNYVNQTLPKPLEHAKVYDIFRCPRCGRCSRSGVRKYHKVGNGESVNFVTLGDLKKGTKDIIYILDMSSLFCPMFLKKSLDM